MTSKEAFEILVELANKPYHTEVKAGYIQTVRGYPIDNIREDLEVLEILLKYDVLSVIGIDEDKEKVKWYIATHKKMDL